MPHTNDHIARIAKDISVDKNVLPKRQLSPVLDVGDFMRDVRQPTGVIDIEQFLSDTSQASPSGLFPASEKVTAEQPFGTEGFKPPVGELRTLEPEEAILRRRFTEEAITRMSGEEKVKEAADVLRLEGQFRQNEKEVPFSRLPFTKPEEAVPTAELPPAREGIGFVLDIISARRTQENPEGLGFVDYARQFPAAEAAIVGLPAIATLGVLGYQGIRTLIPLTKDIGNKTLQAALNTGIDKWIARMSRGIPPQKFKEAQNILFNLIARDKIWLQQRATENMVRRQGRTSNVAQAARQAVEDTIRDVEQRVTAFIPRATRTGALAQGGLSAEQQAIPTVQSVAAKIAGNQALNLAERQLYANQAQEVEAALQAEVAAAPVTPKVTPEITVPEGAKVEIGKGIKITRPLSEIQIEEAFLDAETRPKFDAAKKTILSHLRGLKETATEEQLSQIEKQEDSLRSLTFEKWKEEGLKEVVTPKVPVARPTTGTQQVEVIQEQGSIAPESVPPEAAEFAHKELAAPDGPKPPKPPVPPETPIAEAQEPSDILRGIAEKVTRGERPDQTLLRLHEGAINSESVRTGVTVKEGSEKLKALGIGVTRRAQLVPRPQDIPKLDVLYNALHNPSKVASGEIKVPAEFEEVYQELRSLTDWEQAARLDFDPEMATVQDYFYRGWKPPEGAFVNVQQGRPLVKTPSFKKPRVNATYQEMRDAGFEPLFWNPYQQWSISRIQGTKYREQMELVENLKGMGDELIKAHDGGPTPEGWRVPEVGPAFEGKPFAIEDPVTGGPTVYYSRRWIVPDKVANTLENIYGKPPTLQKFVVAGKSIDPLAIIDALTFIPKRAKLFLSFFQQVDFLTRAGANSWARGVDELLAGNPIEAIKAPMRYPKAVFEILQANFSPTKRLSLAKQLDSTKPLVKGRPGVHFKGISEAGLSTRDVTIFPKDMDKLVHQVATETGVLSKIPRVIGDLESAMRRGLFDGVYPAAIMTSIKNNIAPMTVRQWGSLTDAQINGLIARQANTLFSTIPPAQSVIQNRVLREGLKRLFFSIGESEGLLRQATGAFHGPSASFWRKQWIGTYIFLITTAFIIHYASSLDSSCF